MSTKAAVQRRRDREIERFDTFIKEHKYTEKQASNIKLQMREGLSDRKWADLKRTHVLPAIARDGIHRAIWAYWDFQISENISPNLGKKIEDFSARLNDTRKRLVELALHPDFFKGSWVIHDKSPLKQMEIIEQALTSLNAVDVIVESAKHRIRRPPFKRHPYYHATWKGIMTLEVMMAHWDWLLQEQHARFAADVFCGADPHLNTGPFERIFKNYLSVRPEWGTTSFWTEPENR
jgi:hypothetical protein